VLLVCLLLPRQLEGGESAGETRDCGVGCIYGVLRLHDKPVTVAEVEKRIDAISPETPYDRLSLKEIRETIESFGLSATTVRFPASEYGSVPPGTILFLRPDKVRGHDVGHVILLRHIAEDGVVHLTDFTAGIGRKEVSAEQLQSFWDGEAVLVSEKPTTPFPRYVRTVVGIGLLLAAALLLFRLRRGRAEVIHQE